MLFGVFAVHAPESCPLNNKNVRKIFLQMETKLKTEQKKFRINKIVGFYMSVLEHQWVIVMDADDAHDIEQFCIAVGISTMSTVKIVPMNDFSVTIKRLKKSSK